MKKGFTLIELLAVIVILAIIALIATPIVLGMINKATLQSKERTRELIAKSIENAYSSYANTTTDFDSKKLCEYLDPKFFSMENVKVEECNGQTAKLIAGKDKYTVTYKMGKTIVSMEGSDKVSETVINPNDNELPEDEYISSPEEWFTYTDNTDGTITVTGFSDAWDRTRDIVIPITHDGKNVTLIGDRAFYKNQLTSVTIPSSVTSIGDRAFYDNKLTSVTIPNSVKAIGAGAFNGNKLVNNQAIIYGRNSDGTEDKHIIVSYGGANKDVVIPNSVKIIGKEAFANNQLTSVTIPNSVTTINGEAFYNNKLTSVTIPSSVTSIGDYAFYINQLTSVTIPNSVTGIGSYAFRKNQLTSVTIPSSVTSLASNAFDSGVIITRN